MKRLTIRQAIKYAVHCTEKVDDYELPVVNRECLKKALSHMCRISNNAREIVGAAKLIRIVSIMEEGYMSSALKGEMKPNLDYQYESRIEYIVGEKVERIVYMEKDANGKLIEVSY